jgi:hypothetical protein
MFRDYATRGFLLPKSTNGKGYEQERYGRIEGSFEFRVMSVELGYVI